MPHGLVVGGALRYPILVGYDGRRPGRLDGLIDARRYLADLPADEQYYAVPWIDHPVFAMCPLTGEIAELARAASLAAGTLIGGVDLAENLTTWRPARVHDEWDADPGLFHASKRHLLR